MGYVVDPEPLYLRTVSMTWFDPCTVEVRAPAAPMSSRSSLLPTERDPFSIRNVRFPGSEERIT